MDWLTLHPFLSFMNDMFRDMLNSFIVVYVDYILICSQTVLHRLLKHGLYATIEKCEFHKTEIEFLDYHIGPDEVRTVRGKVTVVIKWPEPTTVKELQQFLGFVNFYSCFIQGYSTVAAPLTDLREIKSGEYDSLLKQLLPRNSSSVLRFENCQIQLNYLDM